MEGIGTRLKAAREAKGLSLEDVQQALKIRSRYLEAIEAGELGEIPGLVYARGFIRTYARYLGVDITEELAALTPSPGPQAVTAERLPSPATAEAGRRPTAYAVAAGVIVVAVLVLVLTHPWSQATVRHHGSEPSKKTTAAKSPKKTKGTTSPTTSQGTPTVTDTGAATAVEAGGQKIAGESYAVSPGPLTATLNLDGPCWVEVDSDGSYSQFSLSSGVYTYTATSSLHLVLGRPASVTSLSLDGHALGPFSGTTPTAVIAHAD